MSTDVSVRKLNKEVRNLRKEVVSMRKVFLEAIIDSEGGYKKSFVKKILSREKDKPLYRFSDKKSFLKHVRAK